ncbi:phosphotransferase family enzyme [Mumia flava]|uniref:Phosphotransferase family enzyme n=1 Tax=Mumia flava TaxID=1348852 RepID=A0A2M9BH82_9ACTN|nr:phosphotransferase family enzyme [Mumia flava]
MSPDADTPVPADEHGVILRRRRPGDGGLSATQEARLIQVVSAVSPLPLPRVLALDVVDDSMELERLGGVPLRAPLTEPGLAPAERTRLGGQIGAFTAALHTLPAASVSELVPVDATRPSDLLASLRESADLAAPAIGTALRGSIAEFLETEAPPSTSRRVLAHTDLGADHVYVASAADEPLEIVGVVDWSGGALADPALDVGLMLRDLGSAGLYGMVRAYTAGGGIIDPPLLERALFHARARAIADLVSDVGSQDHLERASAVRSLGFLLGPGATARVLTHAGVLAR